jgi:hypothetical protein
MQQGSGPHAPVVPSMLPLSDAIPILLGPDTWQTKAMLPCSSAVNAGLYKSQPSTAINLHACTPTDQCNYSCHASKPVIMS